MKKLKIVIEPGLTYSVEEFASSLKNASGAKKRFLKDHEDGYYLSNGSYRMISISDKDVSKLVEIVGDVESIYKFFNTNYLPFDIVIKEIGKESEKVESNNIYDKMSAKTITQYEGSFKIKVDYTKEPITVTKKFSKDTTLSMRDIVNFM